MTNNGPKKLYTEDYKFTLQ